MGIPDVPAITPQSIARLNAMEAGVASAGIRLDRLAVDIRDHGAVADGLTNDAAAVNAAIAALPASGGRLVWPATDVRIGARIIIDRPITIQGAHSALSKMTMSSPAFLRISSSNVTINDMTIQHVDGLPNNSVLIDNTRSVASNYTGWAFNRCRFRKGTLVFTKIGRTSQAAAQATGSDFAGNLRLIDCEFVDIAASYALEIGGVSGAHVDRCWVHGNGITLGSDGEGIKVLAGSDKVRVTNCLLEDNLRDGIDVYDSVGTLVSGCVIRNNGSYGIDAKWDSTAPGACRLHRLINNEVINNAHGGINASTPDTLVSGNVVRDNEGHGIRVGSAANDANVTTARVRVAGNQCVNNVGIGIYTSNATTDVTIDGNECYDNTISGIEVLPQSVGTQVRGNICLGNGTNGLKIHGTSGVLLAGNRTQDVGNAVILDAATAVRDADAGVFGANFLQAGRYLVGGGTRSTIAMVSGREYVSPIWIGNTGNIVRIGCEITVAGTAGTVIRLGLRRATSDYLPGAVIGEATVPGDAVTASGVETTVSFLVPKVGLYYLSCTAQVTGATLPTMRALSGTSSPPVSAGSIAGAVGTSALSGYFTAAGAVTGALPATYTINDKSGVVPLVAVRA